MNGTGVTQAQGCSRDPRQHRACRRPTHLGNMTHKSQHKTQHQDVNLHWQFLMSHLCRTEMCIYKGTGGRKGNSLSVKS